jgi:hypothetical protein
MTDRTRSKPTTSSRASFTAPTALSVALTQLRFEVREPGTDITLGTTFYTPVVTLLARLLGTHRQDVVYCAWPLLGCPYHYFEPALPTVYINDPVKQQRVSFKEMLDTQMLAPGRDNRPAVLWEILDLLQSIVRWRERDTVEWVRIVERVAAADHPGLLDQLHAMADQARRVNDDIGILPAKAGLTEGLVIPAGEYAAPLGVSYRIHNDGKAKPQ